MPLATQLLRQWEMEIQSLHLLTLKTIYYRGIHMNEFLLGWCLILSAITNALLDKESIEKEKKKCFQTKRKLR